MPRVVTRVVVADGRVEAAASDAVYRDYRCLLLTDCCAEAIGSDQARTNHDATLIVIEALFGWTAASTQFIESITRHRSV